MNDGKGQAGRIHRCGFGYHYDNFGIGTSQARNIWHYRIVGIKDKYPYATKLIADAFFNKAMQGLYGVVVLLITFSVLVTLLVLVIPNQLKQ